MSRHKLRVDRLESRQQWDAADKMAFAIAEHDAVDALVVYAINGVRVARRDGEDEDEFRARVLASSPAETTIILEKGDIDL